MTSLYDRKYRLVVGTPSKTYLADKAAHQEVIDNYTKLPSVYKKPEDFRTITDPNAAEIVDLQVIANITSNSNSNNASGKTTIKIYNLSAQTRGIIEVTNNYVILEAGYAEDEELPLIFSGQVKSFETRREGLNLITELVCEEGYTANNTVKISKTFERFKGDGKTKNTYGDVLRYLAAAFADNGIPTGDLVLDWSEGVNRRTTTSLDPSTITGSVLPQDYKQLAVLIGRPNNTPLLTGLTLEGYLRQALENTCKQIGYVSYITNGRLFIHPKGFTRVIEEFEFTTAQIKSIRKSGSKATGSAAGIGIDGVTLTTFLDGRLDSDKRIKILDGDFEGTYKVISKEHKLDYENGAWDTHLVCKSV